MAPWSSASSLRRRAATAPASSVPSRRSSSRWSITALRSTSASRSSTTPTSSATSRRAARSSSTTRARRPRARRSSSPRTASRPSVHERSAARGLNTIDATCPLVTKVHVQARRYAADGYTVVLIGHAGHEEVVGTMGEAPDSIVLVESVDDAERLELRRRRRSSRTSRRRRCRWTRRWRSSPCSAAASRRSTRRRRKTSVTRRPTGSGPSRRCPSTIDAAARDRLAQLVELEPAGRGRARHRRRVLSDRRRVATSTRRGSTASRSSA